MVVQKFGGTSVQNPEKIKHVAMIIRSNFEAHGGALAVLSAMKGVTDLLLQAAGEAESSNPAYKETYQKIFNMHTLAAQELITLATAQSYQQSMGEILGDLRDILHGVELVKECSPRTLDLIAGFGERLNCLLMTGHLASQGIPAQFFDTSKGLIITDDNHGSALVDFQRTNLSLQATFKNFKGVGIVTGYVAVTEDGKATTLGRNGSDYTSTILAAGVGASAVEIWKDVDGVLTADPNQVKGTYVIDELSVEEAMELSYFGAEVIHPSTMVPLVENGIPLWIKNTYNPSVRGTLIAKNIKPHGRDITGIASIPEVSIINVEGGGMQGIPGFASRVFGALASRKVNVIMISQASSEQSICIVIRQVEVAKALEVLNLELSLELDNKKIKPFAAQNNLEVVAVIGENMKGRPGITGRLFSALGSAQINVLAIAQGSSERNISFVIADKDKTLALNTVHKAFLG